MDLQEIKPVSRKFSTNIKIEKSDTVDHRLDFSEVKIKEDEDKEKKFKDNRCCIIF